MPSKKTMHHQIDNAGSYFAGLCELVERMPLDYIDRAADLLLQAYHAGQTIFLFGNGGSAGLASHLACDLGKGTLNGSGKRFHALALTDNIPLITAWANDSAYENIFAEQLSNFVKRNDIAFAISGSGNSPNVLRALEAARVAGAITVGLTGFEGGRMKNLCDVCMIVPSDNMQHIEDLHLCAAHALFSVIRTKLSKSAAAFA
jgi:D-sedoheptulose 7-phosphate isomerase